MQLWQSTIYENPLPQLRSRHSYFPCVCRLPGSRLLAAHVVAEAFESVDGTTRLSVSTDEGRTWELLPPVYDKQGKPPTSDCMKPTCLQSGEVLLFGYEFLRDDPALPAGNPQTGGLLPSRMILMRSFDLVHWSGPFEVPSSFTPHVEASAPLTELAPGTWVTPIAPFPAWDGSCAKPLRGRLLMTSDGGKSWRDNTVTMTLGESVSVYEQRLCRLASGMLVVIAWNEDLVTGELLANHYALSMDGGKTFQGPFSTGIKGQASSVMALGGERLLALHALRRDTDRPGIYAYIVNLSEGRWAIEAKSVVYEPPVMPGKDKSSAEVFAYLKFGQPSAILLSDGTALVTFWVNEFGQGRTVAVKLALK